MTDEEDAVAPKRKRKGSSAHGSGISRAEPYLLETDGGLHSTTEEAG